MAKSKVRRWYEARQFVVRVLAGLIVLAGLLIAALLVFGSDSASDWAPVLGACVAVLSLLATATAAVANWLRQKRESAIKAWTEWSDTRMKSRQTTQEFFGDKPLTAEQGMALVAKAGLRDARGVECDAKKLAEVGAAVVHILNGLERLAAGSNLKVYDAKTLRALGGTIIVTIFKQFESYIRARRTVDDENLRRRKAFKELQALVLTMRLADLDEERIRHLEEA